MFTLTGFPPLRFFFSRKKIINNEADGRWAELPHGLNFLKKKKVAKPCSINYPVSRGTLSYLSILVIASNDF